ncbi:hypothetical protein IAE33_003921 [Pseudomonas sp. S60]|uniref:DUF6311 domain-containing protein n=1 Tax=Pseudomonas sp. S60 TaxID=211124 RepID=UPI001913CC08|nr:DUF6311 domain-containing protein [Pseudomonas sp. S60]MBK5012061.1 hypothetical protein [Pseudomonas sp. S60]
MGSRLGSTGRTGLALALAIAVWFVWHHFPAGFIAGTSTYWQSEVDDVTQYISGFHAFFNAPFGYPLLAFDSINYPQGTRATFMDTIPLYALLLKLVVPSSYAPFNPYGVWVGLAFLGQAVCAWWILRELEVKSWLALVALVVCLLIFPAFTARVTHISLMTHWIILAAIALYLRGQRLGQVPVAGWTALLVAGFYINIYLCVMASAIYVANWLAKPRDYRWLDVPRALLPFVIIGASLWVTVFPMDSTNVAKESGFGTFSMNLLAPFAGGKFFPIENAEMPGQYEGFNYLGLGVLLGLLAGLVLGGRRALRWAADNWPLVLVMLGLTLYALSDTLYWGTHQVLVVHYPAFMEAITTQFRASGRFFWPVGYALTIAAIVLLYRRLPKPVFALAMLVLVVVQVADMSIQRHRLIDGAKRPATPILTQAAWDAQIADGIQYLYFFPKFRCGRSDMILSTLMPTMRYAVEHGLKINTGYVARANSNCAVESTQAEIVGSDARHSLYVFVKGDFPEVGQVLALFPADRQPQCSELDYAHVCKFDANKERH